MDMNEKTITLSRELIYNEVWELSVKGVARKYDIPYARLLKACKEADIPIPSTSYWMSPEKSEGKIALPESEEMNLTLPVGPQPKRAKKAESVPTPTEQRSKKYSCGTEEQVLPFPPGTDNPEITNVAEEAPTAAPEQQPYRAVHGQTNTYDRDTLYHEVWEKPVVQVAQKYGVSDVAIHKVCKSLNIPVPPRGYWAKVRAGVAVEKTPLPETDGRIGKLGIRSYEGVKKMQLPEDVLGFLSEDERRQVLSIAEQMQIPDEHESLHPMIRAHKKKIKEWEEQKKSAYRNRRDNPTPPLLAEGISPEQLPRVFRILGALYQAVEALGGSINDDLSLKIRGEQVRYEIVEGQDKIEHVLTKEEAKALLGYEDKKKRSSWASKPQIRKYDYVNNGRLRITVLPGKYHRDKDNVKVEDLLGNILVDLYQESQNVRLARIAREEEQRKRKEEERRKEERLKRYNAEVEQTNALVNMAEDYDMACKIRTFVQAVENNAEKDMETLKWIAWAKKKADWFDPTVAREDEVFGKREHERDVQSKSLRASGYHW